MIELREDRVSMELNFFNGPYHFLWDVTEFGHNFHSQFDDRVSILKTQTLVSDAYRFRRRVSLMHETRGTLACAPHSFRHRGNANVLILGAVSQRYGPLGAAVRWRKC